MKTPFLVLLTALLACGCLHRYDITLVNDLKITHVTRPKLDPVTGMYSYKNIRGETRYISATRVVEIAPHQEPKLKKGQGAPPQ